MGWDCGKFNQHPFWHEEASVALGMVPADRVDLRFDAIRSFPGETDNSIVVLRVVVFVSRSQTIMLAPFYSIFRSGSLL